MFGKVFTLLFNASNSKVYFRQVILQPENNPMLMGRESENVIGHHQRSFKWREAAIEWNLDWKDLNWADSPRKIF